MLNYLLILFHSTASIFIPFHYKIVQVRVRTFDRYGHNLLASLLTSAFGLAFRMAFALVFRLPHISPFAHPSKQLFTFTNCVVFTLASSAPTSARSTLGNRLHSTYCNTSHLDGPTPQIRSTFKVVVIGMWHLSKIGESTSQPNAIDLWLSLGLIQLIRQSRKQPGINIGKAAGKT